MKPTLTSDNLDERTRAIQLLAKAKEIEARRLKDLTSVRINRRTVICAAPKTIDYYLSRLGAEHSDDNLSKFPNYPQSMRDRDNKKAMKAKKATA